MTILEKVRKISDINSSIDVLMNAYIAKDVDIETFEEAIDRLLTEAEKYLK